MPKTAGPTEAQVTAACVKVASWYGVALKRRNVGGNYNPRGRYVSFGAKGDSDYYGTVASGPNRGRTIEIEFKRASFDPRRLKRGSADDARFRLQVLRLRECNRAGGIGTWFRSEADALEFFRMLVSHRVAVDLDADDFPVYSLE